MEDDGSAHIVNSAGRLRRRRHRSHCYYSPLAHPSPGGMKPPSPSPPPTAPPPPTTPRTCLKAVNTMFGLETKQRDSDVQQTWHSGRKLGD